MIIPFSTIDSDYTEQVFEIDWPVERTKTPGLVVHKMVVFDEDDKPEPFKKSPDYGPGYWWSITHYSSGWGVWSGVPSSRVAQEIATRLGQLDWTINSDEIKLDKRYGKLVRRLSMEFE